MAMFGTCDFLDLGYCRMFEKIKLRKGRFAFWTHTIKLAPQDDPKGEHIAQILNDTLSSVGG